MGPKKAITTGKEKRKIVRITVERKKEIIAKYENGVRVSDLASQYGMAKSTISTFLKNKDLIKAADVAKGVTMISKQRPQIMEELEKLLLIFIKKKELAGNSISEAIICKKALQIYNDLEKETPSTSTEGDTGAFTFKASRGWFENFKHRSGIHSLTRHGGTASTDKDAAKKYVQEFSDYIKAEGFLPQQVFNCDETGLFWKRMPSKTYITKEEKALPGHKPMEDRLTLLLCGNASGDCKVKPLLVYHSDNPGVFKKNNIMKGKLPVMWRANSKTWVTRQFFKEWVQGEFAPNVKKYLQERHLPVKCLLVMDNIPAHPLGLEDELLEEHSFIKVKFLPPYIAPILQPMGQQVISNFKKLYTKALFWKCFQVTNDTQLTLREFWKDHFSVLNSVNLIDIAWDQISDRTLNSAWQKLWPDCVLELGLRSETGADTAIEEIALIDDIVSMGRTMGLEVEKEDIDELVEGHSTELTTQELLTLQQEQQKSLAEKLSSEEGEREDVQISLIKEMCDKWSDVQLFVEKYHPDIVVANRAINIFNDNVMFHFKKILKRKQLTVDKFLVEKTRKEARENNSTELKRRGRKGKNPFPSTSLHTFHHTAAKKVCK